MKSNFFTIMILLSMVACTTHSESDPDQFKSQRTSQTASFVVDANIKHVFPLYGTFEERKWAPGWEPKLIYPEKEVIEEGTAFKVEPSGHSHGEEGASLWIVSKYEPKDHLIQYLVSTQNRFWTITVKSTTIENDTKTKTTVTYTYTGLNHIGNSLNQRSIEKMYENNLQDWADLINAYLKGK